MANKLRTPDLELIAALIAHEMPQKRVVLAPIVEANTKVRNNRLSLTRRDTQTSFLTVDASKDPVTRQGEFEGLIDTADHNAYQV
jgi:hypothetical protein